MITQTKGILHPDDAARHFSIKRYQPARSLKGIIEHYWIVRWNLPQGTYTSKTLVYPAVNVVISTDAAEVGGPTTKVFSYELAGSGAVYGVLFTPAGFSAFYPGVVADLANRRLPVASIAALRDLKLDRCVEYDHDEKAVEYLNAAFMMDKPRLNTAAERLNEILVSIRDDRSITKVADVSRKFMISERTLQYLCRRYVGITPKFAIMRYRMQDAAYMLSHNADTTLAHLAQELGYVDQAHFAKDFKNGIGMSPLEYMQSAK